MSLKDTKQVVKNFQTLRQFIEDLKNQMGIDIPDIYLRLQQADNKDVGQSFLSDLFWSAFNLITTVETLQGKEFIAWILGAIIQDIHDNIGNYPDLNKTISEFIERYSLTLTEIENQIAIIISDPEGNWNKTFTYGSNVVKVSDFDTFDFVYGGVGYQQAQVAVQKKSKKLALKNCFPYDRWKIAFWFGEQPQKSPCNQCNWGCDGYEDSRYFFEDVNAPVLDYDGNQIAKNANDYISQLVAIKPAYIYINEPVMAINCRFAQGVDAGDIKQKCPNGAYFSEFLIVEGRDNFLNDWTEFDADVAKWMFKDDGVGGITNPDGFVDRYDFYYNWGLDASNCLWKRQFPPDPNSTNWFKKMWKWLFN